MLTRHFPPEAIGRWRVLCLGCGGPSHQEANRPWPLLAAKLGLGEEFLVLARKSM